MYVLQRSPWQQRQAMLFLFSWPVCLGKHSFMHTSHVRPLPTHAAAHVCPVELLLGFSHGNGAIKGRATSWYSSATSVSFVQARLSLFHTMLAVFCYNSCEAKIGNLTFLCNLVGMCACIYLCSKMRFFLFFFCCQVHLHWHSHHVWAAGPDWKRLWGLRVFTKFDD